MSGGYELPDIFLFLIQQDFIDGSTESRLVGCTYDDLRLTILGDKDNGRERLDAHSHGKLFLLVRIDLIDNDAVAIFLGQIL